MTHLLECTIVYTQTIIIEFSLSVLQVAAVIGIGLVYQGTGHRHNAEVLLSEIGVYVFVCLCVFVCAKHSQMTQ